MNDSALIPQAVSPRWLWGLRLATVVAALPLLFMAFLVLRDFIRLSREDPWNRWVVVRMGLGSVVLVSAVIPYLCILWHARKNPPHENG